MKSHLPSRLYASLAHPGSFYLRQTLLPLLTTCIWHRETIGHMWWLPTLTLGGVLLLAVLGWPLPKHRSWYTDIMIGEVLIIREGVTTLARSLWWVLVCLKSLEIILWTLWCWALWQYEMVFTVIVTVCILLTRIGLSHLTVVHGRARIPKE